jgi:hypothetical protein
LGDNESFRAMVKGHFRVPKESLQKVKFSGLRVKMKKP